MQPSTSAANANGYVPRFRQFSPQSIVWVQNPFDHDVDFQVADELNRPFVYTLPAHKVSELPGGSIATLGVKKLVDALMQNDAKAAVQIWDLPSRAKFEADIIMRIKEAPSREEQTTPNGKIDLSVKSQADEPPVPGASEIITEASQMDDDFPGLAAVPPPVAAPALPPERAPLAPAAATAVMGLPAVGIDSAAGGE